MGARTPMSFELKTPTPPVVPPRARGSGSGSEAVEPAGPEAGVEVVEAEEWHVEFLCQEG